MIVVYKNFFRNRMVNLSKKSVQHFLPNAQFHCISLYKQNMEEYNGQDLLDPDIAETFAKTQIVLQHDKPMDHIIDSMTSGYASPENAAIFSEGYNLIMEKFKDVDEKVLILAEDHFFTTGAVLKELDENDWDLANAPWDNDNDGNASILGIRPKRMQHLFPIPERSGLIVEHHLARYVIHKVDPARRYIIKNRRHINYFGDGIYTNSSERMKQLMEAAGIL